MKNIGFIGLGIMGESMSENLVKKTNDTVLVYDINTAQVEKLCNLGAKAADSIGKVEKACDIIFIMVPTGKNVIRVVEDILPNLCKGKIVVDMSTIEPEISVDLSKQVAQKGAIMLDCPVVKSKDAAIKGELGIYVGGDLKTYEEVKDYLKCMGSNIIHMGDNGKGLVMKICHNMLVAGIQNAVNEGLTLAKKCNLDYDQVVEAIGYGGGQCFYLDAKKNSIKNSDFSPKFSVNNMHKDIHLALSLAEEVGLELQGALNSAEIYDLAKSKDMGYLDFSATYKIVEERVQKL